jgi:hypothetical protein
MAVQYKQQCSKCKKNYVVANYRERYVVCYDCQKYDMQGEITDAEMKKLFGIPEEFYKKNLFLRNIKINYLRYGKLSEKQIEAFRNTVEKMNKKE